MREVKLLLYGFCITLLSSVALCQYGQDPVREQWHLVLYWKVNQIGNQRDNI